MTARRAGLLFATTVLVIVVAVLLDAASGGWDSVSWVPPVVIAGLALVTWAFVRRRSS